MSSSRQQGATSIVLGTHGLHGTACINAVLSGLEAGHRHIDTAQSYGNEEEVGNAIERSPIPRTEITVTTKISTPSRGNPKTFEEAYDSARASLDRMRLSYIDIFLIHAPGYEASARRVTWQALERLVEDGMIRSIGVSNYGIKYLLEMDNFTKIRPQIIQNELHPWCQQRELASFCATRGIEIQAYCCLLRNRKATHSGLCSLASKYDKTTQQILIRYSLQKGWAPVVRSSDITHIRANTDVFGFTIDSSDMGLMDSWNEEAKGAIGQHPKDYTIKMSMTDF